MMMTGAILWGVFVLWMLRMLQPSQVMRHDPGGNRAYYAVWAVLFAGVLLLHYHYMAQFGHATLAVKSDVTGFSIYLIGVMVFWGTPKMLRWWHEGRKGSRLLTYS